MATDETLPQLDPAALQFDAPQGASTAAMSCASCEEPIQAVYYEVNGNAVCARCRGTLEVRLATAGKGGRLMRAFGLGLGAAVIGAVVYYGIQAATGWTIGLVSILVGWGVGKAVFMGSGGRGGRGYQFMAVGLTYFAIASTYFPAALDQLKEGKTASSTASPADSTGTTRSATAVADSVPEQAAQAAPAKSSTAEGPVKLGVGGVLLGIGAVIAFCAILPVLAGMGSPISVLILIFGMVQAWRMNTRVELNVTGPYRIAPPAGLAAEA